MFLPQPPPAIFTLAQYCFDKSTTCASHGTYVMF